MTDKSKVREKLLRLIGRSDLEPMFKNALNEYIKGEPELLKEQYPDVFQLYQQKVKLQLAIVEYNSNTIIDEITREQEDMDQMLQPVILAEENPSTLDREFDIVFDYDLLVKMERIPKNCGILDHDRNLIRNRKLANMKCLVGFIVIMFRNGIYKKNFGLKKGKNKSVKLYDVMLYSKDRYNFASLESTRRYLDYCVELALTRMPALRLFDQQNKQKNQITFNKIKS